MATGRSHSSNRGPYTRLGVFGGTFDPIHVGHLAAATAAREAFSLDRVLFVPAARPPHKSGHAEATAEHRYRMTLLATRDNPAFSITRIELDRPGPSYTVDTLRTLAADAGGAALYLVTGADAACGLPGWHEPQEILRLAELIAVSRPGYPRARVAAVAAALLPVELRPRVHYLAAPMLSISSRDLRLRARAGRTLRYLVPDGAAELIAAEGLYRDRAGFAGAAERAPTVEDLQKRLSPDRFAHSLRVAATAEALARRHNLDSEHARLAGLWHDWARELPDDELLALGRSLGVVAPATLAVLHGPVAARLLPFDAEVLAAIDRHTTGDPDMTHLDMVVYLADLLEPGHTAPDLDTVRALAERDLEGATLAAIDRTLQYLLAQGRPIDRRTVATRNALLVRLAPRISS